MSQEKPQKEEDQPPEAVEEPAEKETSVNPLAPPINTGAAS